MSTKSGSEIIDWKRLWQLVSGIYHETPENIVFTELLNVSKELQDGLLQFEAASSSNTKLETLLKEEKQEKLLPFTQRLQDLTDLESRKCWEILCFYLANEYRGSASSLSSFTTETQMGKLLDDIWGYYCLERMIVLKIVKNLLVFYKLPQHPYHHEYRKIVDQITLSKLGDSYVNQLEHLVNQMPPAKLTSGEFFDYKAKLAGWSERNAREINEVLHILLLIFEHMPVEVEQLKRLFNCFKQHSFGRQQRYLVPGNSYHEELITRLGYSEVVLFLKCIEYADLSQSVDSVREIIRHLNKDISRMCYNPENGPVLLAWMILNIRCSNNIEDDEGLLKYRQFGHCAVNLNCFNYLRNLVAHSMFKDDGMVSRIARKTIYNLLGNMCDLFDGDGSCAKHPFIYELLRELVSLPSLASEFCSQEGGVKSLYNTLLEVFPIDFEHLSMIASGLTSAGMDSYVKSEMESLPILTDLYDENKFTLKAVADNEFVLCHDFVPFERIDFTIPGGASAVVMERAEGLCVHFRTSANYFNVLHNEVNCLLTETVQLHSEFHSSARLRRVTAGLKYLAAVLLRTESLLDVSTEMVHPTEMCIDLLGKFKSVQNPPLELMVNCLNVCTSLLHLEDTEIFTRLYNLNVLPVITNDTLGDYQKYALGTCFDSQLVGTYFMDVEKKLERYDFLLAYIAFLRTYTKLQRNRLLKVEIPGLIFLLREVFCHMHAWRFQKAAEQNKIYGEIMGFVCDILDEVTLVGDKDNQEDRNKRLLRDICVYSFLNLESGLVLLKFIAVGNGYLQHTMELETNWMLQQTSGLMLLVRLSMRILMQILRLKTTIRCTTALSPLEALIYTQPKQLDMLRIIPVVTSYMGNIFDRWLPILSCRLLKRIALEFNMSLLACLDMEPEQIRLTFLQKIPDELVSDSLKIALLELVDACIEKQPGVTEAFFKANLANEKRAFGRDCDTRYSYSILTFMEDYLDGVEKDPNVVQNTLPSKIMNIFHSLWKNNMQILVEELTKHPKFWQQICSPLRAGFTPNVRVYTQLLNILSIEIYCQQSQVSNELKKEVLKFFDQPRLEQWLGFLFALPKVPAMPPPAHEIISDDAPEWLCTLQAFKDFLLIILHRRPQFIEIPEEQLKLLAERCLIVLVERAEYVADLRPFIILSEMYLYVLLSFKHAYTKSEDEDREMLKLLIQLLGRFASCYEDIHVRAKEACLSIAIKCVDLLAGELRRDSSTALNFLNPAVSIICSELQNLENSVRAEGEVKTATDSKSSCSLVLSLNLFKATSVIFQNNELRNWDQPFIANKVCQRLLSCASSILQLHSKRTLSVELLEVLIVFARGNCSNDLLYCDIGDYLWLKLLPPKELLQLSYNATKLPTENWTANKWWPIYARGIELITILFQKHRKQFLREVLQFVGIHEEYLMDSLLLAKQSLEPIAVRLIKCAVMLIASLVEFEKQWRMDHSKSLFNIMRCVQVLMSHSISMFHQPKSLKALIGGRRGQIDILQAIESDGVTDDLIAALNDLTEVITLSIKCLQRFSPPLVELICEQELTFWKWEPILEIHFGAPKLDENAVALSFGTVLSIVGVFVKALNLQNYGFHEVPLNELPAGSQCVTVTEVRPSTGHLAGNTTVGRRPTSKSLSVTSTSSVICSNELLSSLDGELCLMALEHVLALVASQSMLALKNTQLLPREKQLIRREISTELITYHEFVRKKVLVDFREHRSMWCRRKHGQVFMQPLNVSEVRPQSDPSKPSTSARRTRAARSALNSMRVNVVRRLHLQQHHRAPTSAEAFEMSQAISPIGRSKDLNEPAVSSTPHSVDRPPLRRQGEHPSHADFSKRIHTQMVNNEEEIQEEEEEEEEEEKEEGEEEEEEEQIGCFPPEEPKFSPLSYVQLVEEDYLHFMSNLFTVICQSD